MSTLTLNLPDEHIQTLERIARQRKTSVNIVVAELVDAVSTHDDSIDTYDVTRDPIYNIQAHESDPLPQLSQRVNYYLYEATQ